MEYKRIILKLSGEALSNNKDIYSLDILKNITSQIEELLKMKKQLAIVIGGGNIWRGGDFSNFSFKEKDAHFMGMMATTINALALESFLNKNGVEAIVQNSMAIENLTPGINPQAAIAALESGKVVIFGGGTGKPFLSSDSAAAMRAIEIKADVIMLAKNGVDGVYEEDPNINPKAGFLPELTFQDVIDKDIKVVDHEAMELLKDKKIEVIVFNMNRPNNIINIYKDNSIRKTFIREKR